MRAAMASHDFVLIFLVLVPFMSCSTSALGEALNCDPLRPHRQVELTVDGNVEIGAGVIRRLLLDSNISADGNFLYKQEFPEFYSGSSLPEIERFYYMICIALADERFEPERRFLLFLKAQRERENEVDRAFGEAIKSEDIAKKSEAIAFGVASGDSFAQIAIREGLKSENPAIIDRAIASIFTNAQIVSGLFYQGRTYREAFTLTLTEVTLSPTGANFRAILNSGAFRDRSTGIEVSGSVSGGAIALHSDSCSMSTWRSEDTIFEGKISCKETFILEGTSRNDADVWLKLI